MAVEQTPKTKEWLAQLTETENVEEVHIKDGEALIYHSYPVYDMLVFGLDECFEELASKAESGEVELLKVYGEEDSKIKVKF